MPCGRRPEFRQPRTETDEKPSRRATSVFARLREYPFWRNSLSVGAADCGAQICSVCGVPGLLVHGCAESVAERPAV